MSTMKSEEVWRIPVDNEATAWAEMREFNGVAAKWGWGDAVRAAHREHFIAKYQVHITYQMIERNESGEARIVPGSVVESAPHTEHLM